MNEPIFELKNVSYSYLGRFQALKAINIKIFAGEKIALIGANGTGKSTILNLLDGLLFPDKGEAFAYGRKLSENVFADEEFSQFFRSSVGFVFQNPDVQLFCPTVEEDIVFGPLQLGVPKEVIKERLAKLSEFLEIKELLDRSPHQLSLGEKRKAAIASVLSMDTEVILLDEPTAGLDPHTSRHIVDMIIEASSKGKTVITATHDLHIVSEIADTVHVFDKTKSIIRSGTPEQILSDNKFLTANNLLHIHSHKHNGKVHSHPHTHLDHHTD